MSVKQRNDSVNVKSSIFLGLVPLRYDLEFLRFLLCMTFDRLFYENCHFDCEAEHKLIVQPANVSRCSQVKPFLKKLRPTGGLRHLTLIGVTHEQNLRDFKHGFVKQGGTFRPASSTIKTVPTTTVTHDDLPEVSMYVRAIVEKDRAS